MNENVEIKIYLSSKHWEDRYPGARVYINNTLIYENLVSEPIEVNWSGELDDSDHTISVEMYNKKDGDTVTDDDENIINDVLLNIDDIEIDEISLDNLLWSNSVYTPNDLDSLESVTDCVNLGWNGVWKLKFSVPTYLWFLENL